MKAITIQLKRLTAMLIMALLSVANFGVHAAIDGISGPEFNLVASTGYISTPDGDSLLIWGYGNNDTGGVAQYPGPTLIVNQGDVVTIHLTNELPMPVSMVFPGQEDVMAGGISDGIITKESTGPADTVTYTFTADHPGTFMYQSGTRQDIQVEMGLLGAIIVRPDNANQAYAHPDTAFDHEYLFFLTEMDPIVHLYVELGFADFVDNTIYNPVLWFINGRNGPDTLGPAYAPWMPHQPYNILPRVHPGETMLLRVVGGSRDMHPFHTHGNNFTLIGRDGRLLESGLNTGPDLATSDFTLKTVPGQTYDALWNWTGEKLGWDVYGTVADGAPPHNCTSTDGDDFDDTTHEYCPDHGKRFPVILPELQDLTFGGFYSGSPFLGAFGDLPPGEGGLNLNGGMFYMWHSHTEKELVNNDIFPGGMMTMCIVEPPGVPIP
jgi:FtsP/CotA-like multicopper oxidase with cupredoxin domain